MDITIKALKCGDSSFISGSTQNILIDCGSDNANFGVKSSEFANSSIMKELATNQIKNLMITHFHKDHFNGILEIPDAYHFETVYLPYSIIDSKVIYTGAIARLLAIASSRSWGFRLAKNVIALFDKLDKISGNICFLKAGDIIPFDKTAIRVLWPEVTYSYGNLPVKMVVDRDKQDHGIYDPWYLESGPTESLSSIETSLETEFNEMVGLESPQLLEAVSLFQDQFDTYIRTLHNSDQQRTKWDSSFQQVNEAYKNLDRARIQFRARQDEDSLENIKLFCRQQYHSLITSMNAISIVCDCEQRFAYLGDVPATIIDYLCNSFNAPYQCVKIQHHGTDAYYTSCTPEGLYWIISNGGYERRKVCSDFVMSGPTKICTNAHEKPELFCNYYLSTGTCSLTCQKVIHEYHLVV